MAIEKKRYKYANGLINIHTFLVQSVEKLLLTPVTQEEVTTTRSGDSSHQMSMLQGLSHEIPWAASLQSDEINETVTAAEWEPFR